VIQNEDETTSDSKAYGRKDRSGKAIAKGSKIHHITFRDEVTRGDAPQDDQSN
jgi:hypothetical protein